MAVDKELYEKIRVGGSFEKLLSNIELINKVRNEIKTKTKIRMCSVVLEDNYEQITDFIEFAHNYDFDYVTITPENDCMATGMFNNRKDLYLKNKKINDLAKKYNIEIENCLPKEPTNVLAGPPGYALGGPVSLMRPQADIFTV